MISHFNFVLNPITFHGTLPVEIIPRHRFDKANEEQISVIKALLDRFSPFSSLQSRAYECTTRETREKNGTIQTEFIPIPSEEWKYYVVAFEGYNDQIDNLRKAALLLNQSLEFGLEVLVGLAGDERFGYGWNRNAHSYFSADSFATRQPVNISEIDIAEMAENYNRIVAIKPEDGYISKAIENLDSLKALPRDSDMLILGLFSVIEGLITHQPRGSELGDSLKHQIRTKLPLLRKRFQRSLDYTLFFDEAKEDNIWSKLYDYRSKIAHSGESGVTTDLAILRNRENITKFLEQAVKLLILLTLREPVLLNDLKAC